MEPERSQMPVYTRRRALASFAAALAAPGESRQTVAFHYAAIFPPAEAEWYRRFSVLVTGGILSPKQTKALRTEKNRLLAYEWSSAFYPGDPVSASPEWQRTVETHRARWLLNSVALGGGSAATNRSAFWYDFGDDTLLEQRASYLAATAAGEGYDGFFFDTLGSQHLPANLQSEFHTRHPGLNYDQRQGEFLRLLRDQLRRGNLIFTNQGYRNPKAFLPCADLDLSESYFTYTQNNGGTEFRKLWRPDQPWDSITVALDKLVVPAGRLYPDVKFVHLNYAAGNDATIRRAIEYSVACAKLWDHNSYLMAGEHALSEKSDVYFASLGKPSTSTYEADPDKGIAWRSFEKGVVAVNSGPRDATIPGLNLRLTDPPRGCVFLR